MLPLPAGVEVNNTFFLSYHVALLREFGPSLCQAFASCSSGEKVCLAARICYTLQHPPKLLESSRCSGDNFSRYITILSYRFSLESTGSWDGQCVNSLLISAAIAKCRGVNGSGIDMAWLTKLTTMQQGARMIAAFQAALCRNLNTRFWDDVKGRGKIHYIYISGCRLALVSSFTFHSFSFFLNFCSYIYDEVQIAAFNMICTKHFPCRRSAQRGLFVLYGNRGIRRCATELLQTKASLQQNSGWTSMWETGSKVGFLFLLIHPVLC